MRKTASVILPILLGLFVLLTSGCEETETIEPNHPPEIVSFGLLGDGLEAGKVGALVCIAKDPDGDSLTYTWTAPEGHFFGTGDTVLWFAPDEASQYPIYCRVEDSQGQYAEVNFKVQVFPNMLFSENAWTIYNQDNTGFPAYSLNYLWSVAIDHLDQAWAGDEVGQLYRFDGTEWLSWKIGNNATELISIDIDSKNNAWVTGGHLIKCDGTTFFGLTRCPTYRTCLYPRSIAIDKNDNLWMGLYNLSGPSKYDGENWFDFDSLGLPIVVDIAIDNNGDIWYTSDSAVVHYDHENWTIHEGPKPIWRNSIEIDRHNRIWVITETNELAMFDGIEWKYFGAPYQNSAILYPFFNDIIIDEKGLLYGALDEGLLVFNTKLALEFDEIDWSKLLTNENSPIPDGFVGSLAFDSKGNLWGATHAYGASGPDGGGLFKINLSGE